MREDEAGWARAFAYLLCPQLVAMCEAESLLQGAGISGL